MRNHAAGIAALALQGIPEAGRPDVDPAGPVLSPALRRRLAARGRGGWLDRPVGSRAAADVAVNERARGEGMRAVERDARTAEYDWYETSTTSDPVASVAERASQEHSVAEQAADLAAGHESNAGVLAAQGNPVGTRAALRAARGRGVGTAVRPPVARPAVARSRPPALR
jgi:hypothetical protein